MKTTISKLYPLCILLVSVFVFSSCEDDFVKGKGEVVSEDRSVGTFDAVEVEDDIEVYLTQGPIQSLRLEGQANILDVVSTRIHDSKLTIKFSSVHVRNHEPIRVYITIPTLRLVEVSGASRAIGRTDWDSNDANFKIKVSGSGKTELRLIGVNELGTEISGSGKVILSGDCVNHDIDISGSGNVYALDMVSVNADARISGAGTCEVGVTDKLKVRISGSGKIRYRGNPVVETQISGSGKVQKVE